VTTPPPPPRGATPGARAPEVEPGRPAGEEHPEISARIARMGLRLFGVYLLLYGGFMGLSAFAPRLIGSAPFGGLNLAILYGLGLIGAAVALALLYMALCRRTAARHRAESGER
jgi:uncharacterized membrane protein (DUF485 family)